MHSYSRELRKSLAELQQSHNYTIHGRTLDPRVCKANNVFSTVLLYFRAAQVNARFLHIISGYHSSVKVTESSTDQRDRSKKRQHDRSV